MPSDLMTGPAPWICEWSPHLNMNPPNSKTQRSQETTHSTQRGLTPSARTQSYWSNCGSQKDNNALQKDPFDPHVLFLFLFLGKQKKKAMRGSAKKTPTRSAELNNARSAEPNSKPKRKEEEWKGYLKKPTKSKTGRFPEKAKNT